MAIGNPVIATAAIGLIPTIQGVRGNIAGQLAGAGVAGEADKAGRNIGSRFSSSVMSTVKNGLKLGGIVTGAIAGITLKGGFDRALGIEDAQAKMSGLGHDTKTVEKIMGNALASVEGTAFGLDAAATTAAGAVAAGIKPGEQLEQTLKTVANTAAAAGTGMDEIGGIFNTVASVGAAYTGDINMIAQRGIPIWQSLGDTLGKSQAEVKKMATEGKIDFATFETAAADAAGGVATAMGDTTRGSFANMMASVRKLGAMFATGILPLAKTTFQGIQGLLNAVKARLEPFMSTFFEAYGPSAQAGIQGFFDRMISGVENFDATPILNFFKEIKAGLTAFGAAWSYNDGEVTSSGFPGFMEKAAYWIRQFWDSIKSFDLSGIASVFSSLGASMKTVTSSTSASSGSGVASVGSSLKAIMDASPNLIAVGLEALAKALQFMSDNAGTIAKFLPVIVAGFVAWKVHSAATTDALILQRTATAAMTPAMIVNNGLILTNNLLEGRSARQKTISTAATVRQTAAEKLSTAAKKASAIASRVLGVAMRFALGPIGLVITGVTLLATGLYLFFTKTEVGRKLWAKIWGGIKAAALAVVDWFMGTALPFLQSAWQGIAAGALWLYRSAILPAWNGIKTAISAVASWVMGSLVPWLQSAWTVIANTALWLYNNVIKPVWDGIRIAIAVAVTAVLVYIDLLKWYFSKVIAPVSLWLWKNVITPVWNGIKAAIGAVAGWIVNVAWPLIKSAWDAIAGAAKWLYSAVILPVWNAIKTAIGVVVSAVQAYMNLWVALFRNVIAPVFRWLYNTVIKPVWEAIKLSIKMTVDWFKGTAWPLVSKVIGWLKMSFEGWKIIAQAVWSAVRSAISAVVSWFQNNAWPVISKVIEAVKRGFNLMRDSITNAWNFVKDKAIKPVVDWFSNTVKPKIDDFTGKVKDGFGKMKDGVLKAWDAIKDGMKKPINGVIGIYNTHIKDNFNKVIDTIFGDEGAEKYKLKAMTPFATGGYTGPGSKYQPAGVVHADEYVIRKESQNSLRREAPGFLDALNTHGARALSSMGLGYASGGWVKPFIGNYSQNSGYGMRNGRMHAGVDYPTPSGTPMTAVSAGRVVRRTTSGPAGNRLSMSTDMKGIVAGYHHLSRFAASLGQQVSRGQVIGYSGNTGRSTGPHLHFSIKRDGRYVNPNPYLNGSGAAGSAFAGVSTSGSAEAEGWSIPNPFDGLWGSIKSKVSGAVGGGMLGGMLSKTVENTVGGVKDWVTGKIDAVTGAVATGVGAARWTPVATNALTREGVMSAGNLASLLRRMNQESGYNPRAINNWDSNAKRGTPSKGLMQVIDPTFRAYRDKSLPNDIWNPLANIVASLRYAKSRYGSVKAAYDRQGGYANGGYTGAGPKHAPAGIVHADEFVLRSEAQRSISKAAPGFLDRLNQMGASAIGYAKGGLVGYASGGKVSPNAKIGSSKVTVILDGLLGTEKQVKTATGRLADGITKTFQDRFKANQKQTVNKLSDSLKALKSQASQLNKTVSAKSSAAKKSTINRLSDDLADLRKKQKALDPKKQAKQLASVRKQIDSTQSALTKARRGDYSAAASATAAKLKDVQKQIASTEAALKAARRGQTSTAATKAADAFFTKYAASATTKLHSLAKQSDTLTKKLKDAKTALTEAAKVRDEYSTSLTEKFAGGYALSADSATTGIETIIRGFRNSAATVKTFTGQLGQLQSKGMSLGLIDQIAQLGAEDGSKVARNLLTGTDAQIKQITAQYNALNKASKASGTALGKQMHQQGVDSARGYVNGLTSQLAAVTKASEALANNVVSTVRKKLGIKSPSRVMRQDGLNTGQGFLDGVRAKVPEVQRAMADLASPASLYAGEVGAAGAGGRGGVTITGGQFGYSPDEIAQAIRRDQRKQAALHIY